MKRFIFFFFLFLVPNFIFGQKFAYVDTEYILSNIPSYKAAQDKLNNLSQEWQQEIEEEYARIDKLYKDFQAEKVLLTDDMIKQRKTELLAEEKSVKDLQRKYFGTHGELFKKREELIKPIQDQVYTVIQEIAQSGNYAIIFDAASGSNVLFTDPKYDKSDEVLEKLGYKN
ncbi:MAG: OmpH family outer membrane protein [Bacteroidales bacterium]|jgi:outer membrane protein|nr:OmpH family outer membrane protein [Bacteroidales bacterium]